MKRVFQRLSLSGTVSGLMLAIALAGCGGGGSDSGANANNSTALGSGSQSNNLAVSTPSSGTTKNISSSVTDAGTTSVSTQAGVSPPPTVQIALDTSQAQVQNPATLTWSSKDATNCVASGAWSGTRAVAGQATVAQQTAGNYTYTLTCNGDGGTTSASAVLAVNGQAAANTMAITVDRGPASASFNVPFVNVTICTPGTSVCRTVDHVMLDTGSYGLRLLASTLDQLALPDVATSGNTPISECSHFVSGYIWGPVRRADVKLAGEIASNLPIQVIADTPGSGSAVPTECSNTGANFGTLARLGANGILGVGMFYRDCSACNTSTAPNVYFACSTAGCTSATVPYTSQVANPVPEFAVDNNGVVVQLADVPASGTSNLAGQLIFGIGTQSNNQPGAANVLTTNASGYFTTSYKGTSYTSSFIDSGSNGLFFQDDSLPQCGDFYCANGPMTLSAINNGANGASSTVSFTLQSIKSIDGTTAASLVGGASLANHSFDWGLPFFFGRKVFVAISQATTPRGFGPYWAY